MNVGVLKEIKNNENRVALTPAGAKKLAKAGHNVFVEKNAGLGSGFNDTEYVRAGAKIVSKPKEIVKKCRMIMKVKEPIEHELNYFNEGHIVFTYFHFASGKELTRKMLESGAACVAYETVVNEKGRTVLLDPMSAVAGQMSVLQGAHYLAKFAGGRGKLLSEVKGVNPGKAVIIGGGTVGENAAMNALGLRANVTLFELSDRRIKELKRKYPKMRVLKSEKKAIERELTDADLLVGAVLLPGAKAPKIVSESMVKKMKKGSVIVDVAIDQGGCIETIRPTSHSHPVFVKHGVTHYAVTNMPGAYPRTSTFALTNATLPYALKLANHGLNALKKDRGLMQGLNMFKGIVTNKGVAEAFGMKFTGPEKVLALR